MRVKMIGAVLGALMLSGCGSTTLLGNPEPFYPILPDIEVSNVELIPVQHDFPRDTSKPLMVNPEISYCVEEGRKRDELFWTRCGIHPVDPDSNLYRGYDRDNWNNLVVNMSRLESQIRIYQKIINDINKTRQEWRSLNKGNTE